MRLSPPPLPQDSEDRILPLINIVFLLLIFFMVTGALSASDPFEMQHTESQSEQDGVSTAVLYINADAEMSYEGQLVTLDLLPAIFDGFVESEDSLQLKVDKTLDATVLIDVMASARAAGLEKLVLLTLAPDEAT